MELENAEIEIRLDELLGSKKLLESLCDSYRVVDPLRKRVFDNSFSNTISEHSCYELWNTGRICRNCISLRAIHENTTYVKLEFMDGKIFLMTAIPLNIIGRMVVLETLKDTTKSMMLGNDNDKLLSQAYLQIERLNNMIVKDALTDVYSRRYINEKLPVDILNCALSSEEISIMMIDIDFFKRVNDTYGHLVGDCILKEIANRAKTCLKRGSDWIARYGGEEFLVCLPGASKTKAVEIAEKMRRAIESDVFLCGQASISVTASFGVCSIDLVQSLTVDDFIKCADEKLYLAKRNGRNRVES
jgi:diguanylate cyclase (GGDEF)-like protein